MTRLLDGLGGAAVGALLLSAPIFGQVTTRVSLSSAGDQGTDSSSCEATSLSADGRLIAFESTANNLVPGDTNGFNDIFVRDLVAGTTTRVSVSSSSLQGNDVSVGPALSGDGRFVAWQSAATTLVEPHTNGLHHAFVRDRLLNATVLVSKNSSGVRGNGQSGAPRLSHDGRFVAFLSTATNLVAGDTNGVQDIFVRDRDPDGNGVFDETNDTTERVSVDSSGGQSNAASVSLCLSATGRYVVFESGASNLVSGDMNGTSDLFVHDRVSHTTERVSVSSSGVEGNDVSFGSSISSDGRLIAFHSRASNLVPGDTNLVGDVFLRDLGAHTTGLLSASPAGLPGDAVSENVVLTPDGRWAVFQSTATNLVPGDSNGWTDVFLREIQTGLTTRMSVSSSDTQADGDSFRFAPALSADGRYVAFGSRATNLVAGDTNAVEDVFLRDRGCPLASASFRNAGFNPASYTCNAPVLGTSWSGTVDLSMTGHLSAYLYVFAAQTSSTLSQGQVLLGNGQLMRFGPVAGPLASFSFAVPNDSGLCGLHLTTQALHLGTVRPFATSNAMDLVVGL